MAARQSRAALDPRKVRPDSFKIRRLEKGKANPFRNKRPKIPVILPRPMGGGYKLQAMDPASPRHIFKLPRDRQVISPLPELINVQDFLAWPAPATFKSPRTKPAKPVFQPIALKHQVGIKTNPTGR